MIDPIPLTDAQWRVLTLLCDAAWIHVEHGCATLRRLPFTHWGLHARTWGGLVNAGLVEQTRATRWDVSAAGRERVDAGRQKGKR